MIGLFIFLNVLYARAFELPASWSVAPKVYSQDKARDVVRCLTSQIRLNPRPVIMASSNMSPSPWRLDAGMCVIHERSNAVACLPSLIIIGAMKAGTAELQGWLSQHPALYRWKGPPSVTLISSPFHLSSSAGASRSGNGEPHFFDKLTSDAELEAGWSKYLWEGFSISESLSFIENRYTFEKTPAYLRMSPAGIARMARMLPSVRMIAILREPASRAYSHFQQRCRQGAYRRLHPKHPLRHSIVGNITFHPTSLRSEAIVASELTKHGFKVGKHDFIPTTYPCTSGEFDSLLFGYLTSRDLQKKDPRPDEVPAKLILDRGHYAQQLEHYYEHFNRSQLMVLLSEQLHEDFPAAMDKIQQWLGLPRLDYRPLTTTNARGYIVLKALTSKSNKKGYTPMSTAARSWLQAYYQEHNRELLRHVSADIAQRIQKYWQL
eukprot:TRINITY_DN11421_c0_g1_i3.p1 TRINITY_DN11421_c0_g1~~TRINITY_DN11421_c0_g1_i3.p1  ORF type:complete len:435 (+),score=13.49 TRINITY_DN11421_c0_g1_i3:129-1433(+)